MTLVTFIQYKKPFKQFYKVINLVHYIDAIIFKPRPRPLTS